MTVATEPGPLTGPPAPSGSRRLLGGADPSGAPQPLAGHRRTYPVPPHPRRVREDLIATVERAGLLGRGGAGFPTGRKLRAVAAGRRTPVVVVNGTEGEPVSGKDALLLRTLPHLVLDGAALAAAAVGAGEVVVCVDRQNAAALDAVEGALAERHDREPGGIPMRLAAAPPHYVTGEESALVHWLNGGEGKPTRVPPRPFERGVGGRPTLVDNVETLAHLAQIIRFGADWFRQLGTPSEPGTILATVSGAVSRPGVYEVPAGLPLSDLLAGAGTPEGISAVLVGGYFGFWLDARSAGSALLSHHDLRSRGGGLGCGAVAVLPAGACGVAEATRVMGWLAGETAGQCGPCVHGLAALAGTLGEACAGRSRGDVAARLQRWAAQIEGRGACRFPDGAVRFLRSALDVFADDLRRHAAGRPCRGSLQRPILPIPPTKEAPWR